MTLSHFTGVLSLAFILVLPFNTANAAERGVFGAKSQSQHELTAREKNKISAEFKNKFSSRSASSKTSSNPWAAKKAKQKQIRNRMLQASNTWGQCREFSYKQRGQCYARGGDAYTCERYYDARVSHCDENF